MNKEEFLKELESKLDILQKDERDKIIKKYKTQITRRVNKGEKEKKVIESFGSVDELSKKILDEYGIKNNQSKTNTQTGVGFIDELILTFNALLDYFSTKGLKEILLVLLEIAIIVILISLLKMPFILVRELIVGIFDAFGTSMLSPILFVIKIVIELGYFIVAVYMFIKIFTKRFARFKKAD